MNQLMQKNPWGTTRYEIVNNEPDSTETDMELIHTAMLWKWPAFLQDWEIIENEIKFSGFTKHEQLDKWNVTLSYEQIGALLRVELKSTLYGPSIFIGEACHPDDIQIVLKKSNKTKSEVIAELTTLVDHMGISQKSPTKNYSTWLSHFNYYKVNIESGATPYTLAKQHLNIVGPLSDVNRDRHDSLKSQIRKSFLVFDKMFRNSNFTKIGS